MIGEIREYYGAKRVQWEYSRVSRLLTRNSVEFDQTSLKEKSSKKPGPLPESTATVVDCETP